MGNTVREPVYIIYTDGGCAVNPGGRGGCACVIIDAETGEQKQLSEGYFASTNNRMEISAVILALTNIQKKSVPVRVYSDSEYVIRTMLGEYRRKKNFDLWAALDAAAAGYSVESVTPCLKAGA